MNADIWARSIVILYYVVLGVALRFCNKLHLSSYFQLLITRALLDLLVVGQVGGYRDVMICVLFEVHWALLSFSH